jgi:hypothetical protein
VDRDALDRLAEQHGGVVRVATQTDGAVAVFLRVNGPMPAFGCEGATEADARSRLFESLMRDRRPDATA